MVDSPTNNFATLNPLVPPADTGSIFSEGNLKYRTYKTGGDNVQGEGTIGFTSGKWYWEIYLIGFEGSTARRGGIGVGDPISNEVWTTACTEAAVVTIGNLNPQSHNVVAPSTGDSWSVGAAGDIWCCAFDADAGTFIITKNTALTGSETTGKWTGFATSTVGYRPITVEQSGSDYTEFVYNFGQDSSFAGNTTAQGNQDSNDIGDFYYEPPTDYLALCSSNLASPEIALPTDHFNTVLYSGNSTARSITGVGFAPDFTALKSRSYAYNHSDYDTVRGATKQLFFDDASAEATYLQGLTAFDSDGFSLGTGSQDNNSGQTYVAWNWKAGGTAASNTDGTITSSVSANTTAGFSIVSYTGTGANATVGHGLSQAPELVILKSRTATTDWMVGNDTLDWDNYLVLNSTASSNGYHALWNRTDPTSTVFSIGSASEGNTNTADYIAYCFHSVDGYSKVGSFTGAGTPGAFVYTGFKPAYVLVKSYSNAGNEWFVFDNKINPYNVTSVMQYLQAHSNAAQVSTAEATPPLDFLSNGIKFRYTQFNPSGYGMLYMAFAESPFKYSNAR